MFDRVARWLLWSRWLGGRLRFEVWCGLCCRIGLHDWYPVYSDVLRRPVVVGCYWCDAWRRLRGWEDGSS